MCVFQGNLGAACYGYSTLNNYILQQGFEVLPDLRKCVCMCTYVYMSTYIHTYILQFMKRMVAWNRVEENGKNGMK